MHLNSAIPELRDMKMQPALERALSLSDRNQAPVQMPARSPTSDGLTAREREIASLMAGGLSNREIAGQLVISEGTVEVHVKHILSKLGFRSPARWPPGLRISRPKHLTVTEPKGLRHRGVSKGPSTFGTQARGPRIESVC